MPVKLTVRLLLPIMMCCLSALSRHALDMVIAFKNGDTISYPLEIIRSIQFDEMTGLRDEGRESLRLELYPNPTRADLTVGLVLRKGGEVAIDILDAAGRVVGEVYRGPHQGSAEYRWDGGGEGMPVAGVYHCRVRTASGSVTKPFIKQ